MRRPARILATLLPAVLLLGACSAAGTVDDVTEDATEGPGLAFGRYVALGDSFTAAPLVPTTDVAGGCFRSDSNYPSIVADRLDVEDLVDVSCSGADTIDLTRRQNTVRDATVAPQLRVLDRDTDLVTLGIGGNDFDLFHTLVATCSRLRPLDPDGEPCAEELESRGVDLVARARDVATRVERAIGKIRQRAPEATVVLVGYLRLVPSRGQCPQLPFAVGDYELGSQVSRALNAALERAARRTGVEYVDMFTASKGHDVCSEEPWVNGHTTLREEALAYHPFGEGMEAVADQVVAALSR